MTGTFRALAMGALLAGGWFALAPHRETTRAPAVRFREAAAEAGLAHTHTKCRISDRFDNIMPWLSAVGAAVAAADIDGDGWTNLYLTKSGRGDSNTLFRNRGDGTFEDITELSGTGVGNPEGASMHAVFGDIDNDGDADLYVVLWGSSNLLFENLGAGRFRDITTAAGVGFWGYGNGATFLDYDRDGQLDLLVGNYFAEELPDPETGVMRRNDLWNPFTTRIMHESFTHARNGGRNVLYRNLGGNRFADVTAEAGLHFTGWTLAVGSVDLNNDGWPDLYLANDFGPDELYFNTGAGETPARFQAFIGTEGRPAIGDDWWKGMNVDFGDVDGNGFMDIYVTNILAPRYKTDEGNMLWLNLEDADGGRRFVNVGKKTGTHDGGWGWGAKFADFDNDGRLDILAVNGFSTGDPDHTYWYALQEMVTQLKNATSDAADWPVMGERDLSGFEPNRLWLQQKADDGTLRFKETALASGVEDLYNGRGAAILDGDNDGDLDVFIANQGAPGVYYVNQRNDDDVSRKPGGHWLALVLEGAAPEPEKNSSSPASTRDAVGARVRLSANGMVQVRQVTGGTGFAAQSEMRLHFGIGDATALDFVEIHWPSGQRQRLEPDALNALMGRTTRIKEPRPAPNDPAQEPS